MRIKLLWLGYLLLLFVATHYPIPEPVARYVSLMDKAIHASAYFGLTVLTAASFLTRRSPVINLLLLGLILSGYGALDEYLQGFVNRSPDVRDWIADSVGIVLGCLVIYCFRHRLPHREPAMKWSPIPVESHTGTSSEQKTPLT